MKEKKKFYATWWFWFICVIAISSIIIFRQETNNTKQATSNTVNSNNTETKTNPYKITNEYNGTYKFVLNNETDIVAGAINIDGGDLKIKYCKIDNSLSSATPSEYIGFCGLNERDNLSFYISVKNSYYETIREFKCSKVDMNLSCQSMTNTQYKQVDLIYVNNSKDLETVYNDVVKQEKEKKEAEEKAKKEKEEQDFKASCQTYTFEQMARNPENFKGTNVKLTGEVVQAMYGTYSTDLRVNITKEGRYSTYYTDTIYVTYYPKAGEDKILEDDIITIYGTAQGDHSYTSTLGATITLPMVQGKYIEIEK